MLKGKTAVVTGGSRGIGKAICLKFAENGADIAFLYAGNTGKAEETLKELEKMGVKAKAYQCNIADADAAAAVVKEIVKDFGGIHILVNNAGITKDKLVPMMKAADFDWWVRRLSAAAKMYDVVRLDHFRGFESYWAVPAGDKTAAGGAWKQGPGTDYIRAVQKALPNLQFIAEDLGYMTPEVRQLQEDSGYPGMKVLQFAFDSRETSDYLPHTYPVNSVCYTGTHDNLTIAQWLAEAAPEDVAMAKTYLGLNEEEGYVWGLIRGGMGSVSRLCVIQMQDYLELGASARMNFPGTLSSANWTWRAEKDAISDSLAQRIYEITRRYGRL